MSTTRPSTRRAVRTIPKPPPPLPLQFSAFTEKHFSTPDGVASVNLLIQQMVNAINAGNGSAGRVSLPEGIDVAGKTITGVGAPASDSDAISSGHAQSQFSPQVLQPKFDIGGSHALKGLSYVFGQVGSFQATLKGAQYDSSSGSSNLFGMVVKIGHSGTIPSGIPGLIVTFAEDFPHACQCVVAVDDFAAGGTRNISVVGSSVTAHQFKLWSDGSGAGAFWAAFGW